MAEFSSIPLRSDANLQAYYKLENVNDDLGANNLTNNNTVAFNAAVFGNGGDQGTSNSNKYLSTANRLNITGGASSFAFWLKMKTDVTGTAVILFSHNDKTTNKVRFDLNYFDSSGLKLRLDRVRVGVAVDSTTTYSVTLGTSLFYHICCTYDGTNLIVYLNGASVATGTSSGNGSSSTGNDGFYIGADNGGANVSSAIFDDFVVFNRALTSDEVLQIYNYSAGNFLLFL